MSKVVKISDEAYESLEEVRDESPGTPTYRSLVNDAVLECYNSS